MASAGVGQHGRLRSFRLPAEPEFSTTVLAASAAFSNIGRWGLVGLRRFEAEGGSSGRCNTDGFEEEPRWRTSARESAIGGRGACSQPGGGATSSSSFRAQALPRRRAGDCCALRVASLCHAAERGRGEHTGPGVERWGGEGAARKKRRRPLMRGRRLAVLGCARTPAF